MQNLTQHTSRKSLVIIILLILALVVSGGAFYLYKTGGFSTDQTTEPASINNPDYNPPSDDQVDNGNAIKQETVNNDPNNPQNSNTTPETPSAVQTQITAASIEDGTLYIRNEISGIYQDGTCTLTLTKGSQSITKSAGIQPLPKSSTCKGFNIPTSELSSGEWNINLSVTVAAGTAVATTKVEI